MLDAYYSQNVGAMSAACLLLAVEAGVTRSFFTHKLKLLNYIEKMATMALSPASAASLAV
jgi:hypothetical protein